MVLFTRKCARRVGLLLVSALLMSACSTYGERVAPVPLPSSQESAVSVNGAELVAQAYIDPQATRDAFGFDARKAGLLPVRFVIDNQSGMLASIDTRQALLLDGAGNAWPLLSSDKAATRVRASVRAGETVASGARSSLLTGLAGAVAGAAIGVVTGQNVGETAGKGAVVGGAAGAIGGGAQRHAELGREISRDMLEKSLTHRSIAPGALAHGFLFFPGHESEAGSVQSLRLPMQFDGTSQTVSVPVTPIASPPR